MGNIYGSPGTGSSAVDLATKLRAWTVKGEAPRWFRLVLCLGGYKLPAEAIMKTLGYETHVQLKSDIQNARIAGFEIYERLEMDGKQKRRTYWLGSQSLMELEAHRKMIPDDFI